MFEVKVTVDLGEKTLALLCGGVSIAKVREPIAVVEEKPKAAEAAKPVAEEKPKEKPKAPAAAKPKEKAEAFADMDEDAKLEAIKAEVTKHAKKGKSADIKFLLSNFDASRASELAPEDYDAFFDAVSRYGKGESVEKIFPGDENLD